MADYVYYVPFTEIKFTREGDNLVLNYTQSGEAKTDSYENFFTTKPVDKIYAYNESGMLNKFVLKTDAYIDVTATSPQYTGTDYNENITAIKAETDEDKYEGPNNAGNFIGIEGDTRFFVSKIDSGIGNDTIYGTDGDDWLEGGEGNDTIYGGSGVDMLAGNTGDDTIYAGTLNSDGTVTYNENNVEIYGDVGNDTIYSGKGNDFIWSGEGDDTIHLNGGSNTLVFTEDNIGNNTVYNTTNSDTLKLVLNDGTGLKGHKFSELSFSRYVDEKNGLSDDLVITLSDKNKITLKDFFASGHTLSNQLDKIVALDYDETNTAYQKTYSIIKDAVITISGVSNYEGYNVYDEAKEVWLGYTENITASDENGKIYGNIGNDKIYGGKGNNYLNGSEGDDIIYAGEDGKDVISGDVGNDKIYGSEKNYKSVEFYGGSGEDIIYSGAGNDFIWSGEGNDNIYLTNGGSNSLVFVEENFGDDIIYDGSENDVLTFALKYKNDEGKKISQGYYYEDLEFEIIDYPNANSDLKITASYTNEENTITENTVLIKDYYNSQIDKIIAFDNDGALSTYSILDFVAIDRHLEPDNKGVIQGTKYADIIDGVKNSNNTIKSAEGNDIITPNSGNDKIYAGKGENTIYFKKGDGQDTVYSDGGEDYLIFNGFSSADSFIMEENGKDLIIRYGDNDKVTLNKFLKGNHSVKGFVVKNGETTIYGKDFTSDNGTVIDIDMKNISKNNFKGTFFAETIIGTSANNTIKSGGGNDVIWAVGGNNKIYTQSKKDDFAIVHTGNGNDILNAGKGVDTYIFTNGNCNDTVIANSKGSVVLDISGLSNPEFSENKKDLVITNSFNSEGKTVSETITIKNYLKGKLTNNLYITKDGNYIYKLTDYISELHSADLSTIVLGDKNSDKKQKITGRFLSETIYGGNNNDTIKSCGGNDYIYGGTGNDKLYGYINKSNYTSTTNSMNFVFNYDYNGSKATGDGKDTIYNSKNSDKITFVVNSKDSATNLLNNLKTETIKKNLVISYNYDNTGNSTDSITISNYLKHNIEKESIRYIDLADNNGTVLTTLDITKINTQNYLSDIASQVAGWTLSSANYGFDGNLEIDDYNNTDAIIAYYNYSTQEQ